MTFFGNPVDIYILISCRTAQNGGGSAKLDNGFIKIKSRTIQNFSRQKGCPQVWNTPTNPRPSNRTAATRSCRREAVCWLDAYRYWCLLAYRPYTCISNTALWKHQTFSTTSSIGGVHCGIFLPWLQNWCLTCCLEGRPFLLMTLLVFSMFYVKIAAILVHDTQPNETEAATTC